MQYSMGVDIGGTKIATAIVSEYGNNIEKILFKLIIPKLLNK